jgi:hypothetical protein
LLRSSLLLFLSFFWSCLFLRFCFWRSSTSGMSQIWL